MPKKTSSGDPKEIHVRGLLDRVKAFTDESADSAVLFLLGSGASRQSGIKTGGEMVGDWLEMLRKEDPDHETVQEGKVAGHGGWLVPIDGFDELMVGLHDTLELESLDGFLRKRGNERATRYRELRGRGRDIRAGAKANATAAEDPPVKAGAKANATVAEDPPSDVRAETGTTPEEDAQVGTAHGRAQAEFADAPRSLRVVTTRTVPGRTPQEWDSLAMLESDPIKQAQIHEDGLRALPQSAWMAAYAALFYEGTSATAQRAEDLHLRSIDLAGSDSGILTNYANFLTDIRQDHDAAEALYQRALEADPARISTLGNYANFLRNVQGNHEKAEELYQRVLEIDPNRPSTLGNYALLLAEDRQDYTAAEALYKRALEAGPNHANNLINYANFLTDVRQDYAAAEALYKRAMEVDPENADRLRDYANFLTNIRQHFATAGLLYKRAQEIDPDEVNEFGY